MSRAGVPRAVVALVAVASLASLVSCKKTVSLTADQALVETLAPDVPKVYINFSCDTDTTLGFFDAPNGQPKNAAWAFMRHATGPNPGPKNQIEWVASPGVTIISVASKASPADPFPIDPITALPGASFKAKVKSTAGEDPDPGQDHKDKGYSYAIGLTCDPPGPRPPIHVVIDPEMIVRRP
ncbi:MAG: hypothetical protein JF589_08685 [Gemmatimonadetes bacterium]|nr:hypothetical protein [Gemmatimonadota bacterium]